MLAQLARELDREFTRLARSVESVEQIDTRESARTERMR